MNADEPVIDLRLAPSAALVWLTTALGYLHLATALHIARVGGLVLLVVFATCAALFTVFGIRRTADT